MSRVTSSEKIIQPKFPDDRLQNTAVGKKLNNTENNQQDVKILQQDLESIYRHITNHYDEMKSNSRNMTEQLNILYRNEIKKIVNQLSDIDSVDIDINKKKKDIRDVLTKCSSIVYQNDFPKTVSNEQKIKHSDEKERKQPPLKTFTINNSRQPSPIHTTKQKETSKLAIQKNVKNQIEVKEKVQDIEEIKEVVQKKEIELIPINSTEAKIVETPVTLQKTRISKLESPNTKRIKNIDNECKDLFSKLSKNNDQRDKSIAEFDDLLKKLDQAEANEGEEANLKNRVTKNIKDCITFFQRVQKNENQFANYNETQPHTIFNMSSGKSTKEYEETVEIDNKVIAPPVSTEVEHLIRSTKVEDDANQVDNQEVKSEATDNQTISDEIVLESQSIDTSVSVDIKEEPLEVDIEPEVILQQVNLQSEEKPNTIEKKVSEKENNIEEKKEVKTNENIMKIENISKSLEEIRSNSENQNEKINKVNLLKTEIEKINDEETMNIKDSCLQNIQAYLEELTQNEEKTDVEVVKNENQIILNKIYDIRRIKEDLLQNIEKMDPDTFVEKYYYNDEMFTRLILKLDDIEIQNDENARNVRRTEIKEVKKIILELEVKFNGLQGTEDREQTNDSSVITSQKDGEKITSF